MSVAVEVVVSFLILSGAFFTLVGSIGLVRFDDFYARLHGPTKATTLGVGSLLVAAVVLLTADGQGIRPHKVLITLFLFLTAPVSAHLVARAAIKRGVDSGPAGKPSRFPNE